MYPQYKIIDVLAKKAGGPYALSSILMKRARQVLKGKAYALGGLAQKKNDPIQEALENFTRGELSIGEGESEGKDVAPESKKDDEH